MSETLTCKISDGTEWEVGGRSTTDLEGYYAFWLKPIKREPREGYVLQIRSKRNLCMSRKEAEETLSNRSGLEDFEIVKVREVIE